ncbi:cytochrome P450 monooxygenase [Aspergillus piperis CBS 112811]|uniref:Cytochrome P450 monooxygenase n=1 Tax=Aspergillus piperis CBS 112811 TaxID=1448313 RepID=A0A8G1VQI0_9EURO|nr:cytochrome P450 monooxygenase [Aspergillus piperis CBS 112811]RAH60890.1 cytochrome P450 monooxygenase [Aspergillus piperis CBS 112811]
MFVQSILLILLPLGVSYFISRIRYSRFKKYADWPQLPPSLIWGHMKALHEFIARGEERRHIDIVFQEIQEHLGNPPLILYDLRPVQFRLCVVGSHEVAEQIARSSKSFPYSMKKSPTMGALEPLLGPHSIITQQGEHWKGLRKRFNPGFAPQHLVTLLPCILDKAIQFTDILDGYARNGEEFSLDERCVSLTFDIIGAVTMDKDFHAQLDRSKQDELVRLYRELTTTYRRGSSVQWDWLDPRLNWRRRTLSRRIDQLIAEHIKLKFAELKSKSTEKRSRSVLSLSLQDIDQLNTQVIQETCDQLKSFLFAGHDTTSVVLQWTFYILSRTPRVLDKVRRELDDLFGPDPSPAAVQEKLLAPGGEELLKRMSYTSAVIKEILRLYPPSGSARYMPPGSGFNVQLPDGKTLCLDGVVIYLNATLVHREEKVYGPTKDEFIPERWLGNTDTGLGLIPDSAENQGDGDGSVASAHVPASAWRPFERGPRNCIGQELANLEARVILACTVRRFDFEKVGVGALARDATGAPILDAAKGQYEVETELFNTMQVTAKPIDGTVVKVHLAERAT